jgi:hypothetical protein
MRAGLVWRLRATSKRYQPTVFKRRVILSAGWYKSITLYTYFGEHVGRL